MSIINQLNALASSAKATISEAASTAGKLIVNNKEKIVTLALIGGLAAAYCCGIPYFGQSKVEEGFFNGAEKCFNNFSYLFGSSAIKKAAECLFSFPGGATALGTCPISNSTQV